MNFGQTGKELLQELKRSEWLPLYSEDAVSRCLLVSGGVRVFWSGCIGSAQGVVVVLSGEGDWAL